MERSQDEDSVLLSFKQLFQPNKIAVGLDLKPLIQTFEGILIGFGESATIHF